MIDENEVRQGNLFFDAYGNIGKAVIDLGCFVVQSRKSNSKLHNGCKPIPLTPEILEKCGFAKAEWNEFSENLNKIFREKATGYLLEGYGASVYCFKCNWGFPGYFGRRNTNLRFPADYWNFDDYGTPQYLHQLQNLYFALTGEELEVKLNSLQPA